MKKKFLVIVLIVISLALALYNAIWINPYQLKVREECIESDKIDKDLDGLLILSFSDLFYGSTVDEEKLETICETVSFYKPDLLFFTGDVAEDYDGLDAGDKEILLNFFTKAEGKYGKYAVLGDNDSEETAEMLKESGFSLLEDENRIVAAGSSFINVIALSGGDTQKAYEGVRANCFSIVLSHYPDNAEKADRNKSDLYLCGHSLGGKIYLPLINIFYRPQGAQTYYHGVYKEEDLQIDVSDGVGLYGKKARFLTDSELVTYKLKMKKDS